MRRWIVLLCPLVLSSCLYTNVHVPRAYRTATPAEVKNDPSDPVVTGEACSRTVLFLVAWGDSGYAAATRKALGNRSDAFLYDVKSDIKVHSFLLGLYSCTCTVLTGKIAKP